MKYYAAVCSFEKFKPLGPRPLFSLMISYI